MVIQSLFWGCLIRHEVERLYVLNCIIERFYYRDISEQNLQPSASHFKRGQRCIFIHNNDPQHTSRLIKDWLKRKRIRTFACLPYFNPIENLWDELE